MKDNDRTGGEIVLRGLVLCAASGLFACSVEVAETAPPNEDPGGSALPLDDESQCGSSIDWQDVESYDGTLGPSIAFVDKNERPVGHIPGRCTGTLVAYNLFLTAGHCVSNAADAESTTVRFNYQDDPSGNPRPVDEYDVVQLVEHRDDAIHGGNLDYALLRLEGSPGYTWGTTPVLASPPADGDAITIIQHPNGIPKVVEGGTVLNVGTDTLTYNNLDTDGGTSGSGVLNARGQLVGVHENGGCDDPGGSNGATRFDRIIDNGTILGGGDNLWLGNANDTFNKSVELAEQASGTYVPLGGDFDGDGRGDIFWYGRGGSSDSVWYGTSVAGQFTAKVFSVGGSAYEPVVGDFDGDGRDDIFWYGPGTTGDSVWYGSLARTFVSKSFTIGGALRPVSADFDDDGLADIFWHAPGVAADSVWYGAQGRVFTPKAFSLIGTYRPIAGDFDGDDRGDVFLYTPGTGSDLIWHGAAGRTFTSTPTEVSGHYLPFAGDFDGNGIDDIFWYGPSGNADFVWYGNGASFTSVDEGVGGSYTPVTGRFDGLNARTDIYWYRPG